MPGCEGRPPPPNATPICSNHSCSSMGFACAPSPPSSNLCAPCAPLPAGVWRVWQPERRRQRGQRLRGRGLHDGLQEGQALPQAHEAAQQRKGVSVCVWGGGWAQLGFCCCLFGCLAVTSHLRMPSSPLILLPFICALTPAPLPHAKAGDRTRYPWHHSHPHPCSPQPPPLFTHKPSPSLAPLSSFAPRPKPTLPATTATRTLWSCSCSRRTSSASPSSSSSWTTRRSTCWRWTAARCVRV